MFVNMHTQGTGQYIVTHDETGVDLYIVVRIYSVQREFKKHDLNDACAEYNGNAHTRDGSAYGLA